MKTITRMFLWIGSGCLLATTAQFAVAQVQVVQPEEVGVSSQQLKQLEAHFERRVAEGQLAGVVNLVARRGKVVYFQALGSQDVQGRKPMRKDTIFRIYSMTKPIASTALMMLYQEGRFQMRDPLSRYIPEFADLRVLRDANGGLDDSVEMTRAPTVQDVLRHTAGFSHGLGVSEYDKRFVASGIFRPETSLADMMTALSTLPLLYQPGTRFHYSISPDIALRLVEVIAGEPADEYLQSRLFKPLKMVDTGYWLPPETAVRRLSPVHWMKDGQLVPIDDQHGQPLDGRGGVLLEPWSVNSYTRDHAYKGGSLGLLSTAEDYWRFAQAMANGGVLDGARILGAGTVAFMTRNHLTDTQRGSFLPGAGFGLGFAVIEDPAQVGYPSSEGNFFWGGAAATSFWIDPVEELVVVSMTQHMGVPQTQSLREELSALVYGALED